MFCLWGLIWCKIVLSSVFIFAGNKYQDDTKRPDSQSQRQQVINSGANELTESSRVFSLASYLFMSETIITTIFKSQGEDVCYAALEIRRASLRPKKKKTHSSDFSTYSSINTSRL